MFNSDFYLQQVQILNLDVKVENAQLKNLLFRIWKKKHFYIK